MSDRFDTTDLLNCYRRGVFPMADSRDDMRLFLMDPDLRGVLPLDQFHIPRRMKRYLRSDPFRVTVDTAFVRVIEKCAEPHPSRPATWINEPIMNLYSALHRQGYAHSVECWSDSGRLAGGLYGVALGGAFFGESMFSRETDASKIALLHLVARLRLGRFKLLDAQFHNPHLEQFGLIELSRKAFRRQLSQALRHQADFYAAGQPGAPGLTGTDIVQAITQIS